MSFHSENVTMNDVARAAGVSKSAVSKALNNKSDISEEVRRKVFAVCEKLGYQVNFRIQDLIRERKTGITRNIAFVLVGKDFADPAYARAIDGIAQGTRKFDLHLLLETLTGNETSVYDLPPVLRDGRVDGLLITGELNRKVISTVRKLGLPHVILGTYDADISKSSITLENDMEKRIRLIINKLKEKGRQKIGYFVENPDNFSEQKNIRFFEDAVIESGLELSKSLIYKGSGPFSGTFAVMEEVFKKPKLPFDALVCLDLRTAQEISVLAKARCGLNGKPEIIMGLIRPFGYYKLPVPSVYVEGNFDRLACEGVNLLWALISGNRANIPEKIILNSEIEMTEDL